MMELVVTVSLPPSWHHRGAEFQRHDRQPARPHLRCDLYVTLAKARSEALTLNQNVTCRRTRRLAERLADPGCQQQRAWTIMPQRPE